MAPQPLPDLHQPDRHDHPEPAESQQEQGRQDPDHPGGSGGAGGSGFKVRQYTSQLMLDFNWFLFFLEFFLFLTKKRARVGLDKSYMICYYYV